jgi:pimeloyl-ACP methyl ester carboxylesterase
VERDWGERDPAWAGIRSEIVWVANLPVHVLRADGPTAGPTQLLVHGLGGAAINWLEVIRGLSERGPVLAPDLPGFGRSQPAQARASRIEHNLEFLAALIRVMGLTRIEVHGNSMGGMLSTLLAAELPQFVSRLVLVSPALPGPTSRLRELDPETLRRFAPFVIPGIGERRMMRWYAGSTPEELFAETEQYILAEASLLRPSLRAVHVENTAYGKRHPWRFESYSAATNSLVRLLVNRRRLDDALDRITSPTLVVWGDQDRLIGRPVIERALARRPDLDLVELDGIGHVPMLEAPDRYLAAVSAWLDGRVAEVV